MTGTETENDNDETYIKLFKRQHMSDSTLHIGTLVSNNVTAAQALVKARERNGRELQNGEKSLLLSL